MQNRNPLDTQNDDVLVNLLQEEETEENVEQLEESVVNMAQQILDYRNTFPDQLKSTLASLLESQRPILPGPIEPQPGPSSQPVVAKTLGRSRGSAGEVSLTEEDPEDIKKLELLKQKISSNASAIPVILKRMRECVDHMDKLQSRKGGIHPAFKKKRLSD